MRDLAVLIPTRGRPDNIRKVISAWDFTNAWDDADMVLVIDADDPTYPEYVGLIDETRHPDTDEALIRIREVSSWKPMVYKLNGAATDLAGRYFALGFAGDDHLPRTINWAKRYLTVLREMGSGMVYGDDGYQGAKLSTEWAVTSDAVRALDRMVPADVEHMYCDNAMMDLFGGAGALRHLPEVRIEHMHPIVGKAETDAQYQRVNHRDQFGKDRRAYERWRHGERFKIEVDAIRQLRKGRPDVDPENRQQEKARRVVGSGPRPATAQARRKEVQRSGPSARRAERGSRVPRHFANVRAATPEDVMMALADLASQVPADQEIVELGVFQGRTALQLAWGAEQGHGAHVTGIDPWDLAGNVYDPPFTDAASREAAFHNVESLGYADKIELIPGFSHEVASVWQDRSWDWDNEEFKQVGLLYVDGEHTYEGARRDIEAWAEHLAPGARIAVDDYGHLDWPGVGQAVDDLVTEGFLTPIDVYHDRLAVTQLAAEKTPTVITSEGVTPSPYPAMDGQVADGPASVPEKAALEDEWRRVDPEGVAALEASAEKLTGNGQVQEDELLDAEAGTPIGELNLAQLKTLAKVRGIVLGARKDKKAEILQALKDGQ